MNLKKLIETKHPEFYMGGGVGIDTTDHLTFFCRRCKKGVEIVKVTRQNIKYSKKLLKMNPDVKPVEKCTFVSFYCESCNLISYLKFYWNHTGIHDYRIIHNDGTMIKDGVEVV